MKAIIGLLFTIVFVVMAGWYFSAFQQKSAESLPNNVIEKVTSPSAYDWKIPELPSGYEWETKKLNEEEANDYRMSWSRVGSGLSDYGYIPSPLTLYSVELTYDSPEEMKYFEFSQQIGNELTDNGWDNPVNYGDWEIIGMAADGVFTSYYGMVKIMDNLVRTAGYSYNMKPASWNGPGSGGVTCPCQLRLEMFVGDPVNLDEIFLSPEENIKSN